MHLNQEIEKLLDWSLSGSLKQAGHSWDKSWRGEGKCVAQVWVETVFHTSESWAKRKIMGNNSTISRFAAFWFTLFKQIVMFMCFSYWQPSIKACSIWALFCIMDLEKRELLQQVLAGKWVLSSSLELKKCRHIVWFSGGWCSKYADVHSHVCWWESAHQHILHNIAISYRDRNDTQLCQEN